MPGNDFGITRSHCWYVCFPKGMDYNDVVAVVPRLGCTFCAVVEDGPIIVAYYRFQSRIRSSRLKAAFQDPSCRIHRTRWCVIRFRLLKCSPRRNVLYGSYGTPSDHRYRPGSLLDPHFHPHSETNRGDSVRSTSDEGSDNTKEGDYYKEEEDIQKGTAGVPHSD